CGSWGVFELGLLRAYFEGRTTWGERSPSSPPRGEPQVVMGIRWMIDNRVCTGSEQRCPHASRARRTMPKPRRWADRAGLERRSGAALEPRVEVAHEVVLGAVLAELLGDLVDRVE